MLLDGIRVIELANVISGPYAGLTLADYGAEVIKVEMPGKGDPFRGWQEGDDVISPAFFALNRGKKSITLNIKEPAGLDMLKRLIEQADVLIENFRPDVMARLGLDYDHLKTVNSRLVYCSITGMGRTGPDRNKPTFDAIAQAYSGFWSQLTDMQEPEPVGPPIADQLSGQQAATAILAALVNRSVTGQGCRVDISMVSALLAFQPLAVANYAVDGKVSGKLSRAYNSQSYAFVDSDGKPFAVHLSSPQKFWDRLIETVERPELMADARFCERQGRIANYHELHEELQYTFRTRPRDLWVARLQAKEVPASPIHTIDEALATEQVWAQGVLKTVQQNGRDIEYVTTAANTDSDATDVKSMPAPNLGEHTAEVLGGLGVDESILRAWTSAGII